MKDRKLLNTEKGLDIPVPDVDRTSDNLGTTVRESTIPHLRVIYTNLLPYLVKNVVVKHRCLRKVVRHPSPPRKETQRDVTGDSVLHRVWVRRDKLFLSNSWMIYGLRCGSLSFPWGLEFLTDCNSCTLDF